MNRILKQRLIFGGTPCYDLRNCDGDEICFFNLNVQLELLFYRHLDTVREYRHALISENGDILCSSEDLTRED